MFAAGNSIYPINIQDVYRATATTGRLPRAYKIIPKIKRTRACAPRGIYPRLQASKIDSHRVYIPNEISNGSDLHKSKYWLGRYIKNIGEIHISRELLWRDIFCNTCFMCMHIFLLTNIVK